jgi:hypothetical protein
VVTALRDTAIYDNILFTTLLITGFKTLQWLAELVWPNSPKHQSYCTTPLHHSLTLTTHSTSYTLPHHKGDSLGVGSQILLLAEPSAQFDPLLIFQEYISTHDHRFPYHPQLWLTEASSIPTCAWFLHHLHQFFPPTISGHSMRTGGATALAAAGVVPALIQAVGCWSSDCFQMYIRQHPFLLHLLIHASPA